MSRLDGLDREQLLKKIHNAVSEHIFAGLKADETADSYRRRGEMSGAVMGRVMAVLLTDDISPEIAMTIRTMEGKASRAMADNISMLVRPGGELQELWRREREGR